MNNIDIKIVTIMCPNMVVIIFAVDIPSANNNIVKKIIKKCM